MNARLVVLACLLAAVGLAALGVGLALLLNRPGAAPVSPSGSAGPVAVSTAPSAPAQAEAGNLAREEKDPTEFARLSAGPSVVLLWSRGTPFLKGLREERVAWTLELNFPVADVRRGDGTNEVVAASVDALATARINAASGVVTQTGSLVNPLEDPAAARQAADDVALARALHPRALEALRAKDTRTALAECDKLRACADRLAKLGRQDAAWKIWSATRKITRALRPEPAALPPKPEEQPRDDDLVF